MNGFVILDHTADAAIAVEATRMEGLFAQAALGAIAVMEPNVETGRPIVKKLELAAGNREDLLVDWLNEILFLVEKENFLFEGADFRVLEEGRLEAELKGKEIVQWKLGGTEIKAVTSHKLAIHRSRGFFRVVVTFDL